ncbi:MAG: TonB-dependent receptor [Asticcacaulis sp.]
MKRNTSWILATTALSGILAATGVMAQSTATQDVEAVTEVIVTGQRALGPTKRERGPKAKATIGQDVLSLAPSGQTFADSLNLIPGYNFSNNDAYGSSGGAIVMRGLDSDRVSLTIDGLQINDSGNYAIYTNQMIDSELLCAATVSTGATDIDSISASATGGTINVASCLPEETFGGVAKLSVGESDHRGIFLKMDSGSFGPWGTRAYLSYSGQHTDTWTKETPDDLRLQKNQYNALIHQDIGERGSFINMAVHWNENRNHFIGTQSKAQIAQNGYGVTNGTLANVNPSDTGNIRFKSKWVLNDKLTLTIDPSLQYTLALGGSTNTQTEDSLQMLGSRVGDPTLPTYLKSGVATPYFDYNGDGQHSTLQVYRPNITNTYRYALQAGLIYRMSDAHLLRFSAAFDRAKHRQTGESSIRDANGAPVSLWSGKKDESLRIVTADGNYLQRRNRLSYADVDVFSAEYRGRFMEDKLGVSLGIRHQKLERELNQFCYSPISGGGSSNPYCSSQDIATTTDTADADVKIVTLEGSSTRYFTPYQRTVSFSKTLPNVGLTWNFDNGGQIFGTYAESMSSPRTDVYYNVVLIDNQMRVKNPVPETSENIELGYRYTASNFNGTATVFYATDENRIVSAYDEETATYTETNVGKVQRQGVELSANYAPVENIVLSTGLTYTDAEMQGDLPNGVSGGVARYIPTAGKQLTGSPKWQWTVGLNYDITDALMLNLNGKYVGDRYYTFVNDEMAPHYTLWNASLRYDMPWLKQGTYMQLNVVNLFDKEYLSYSSSPQNNSVAFTDNTGSNVSASTVYYQLGAPRTVSLTLRTQF